MLKLTIKLLMISLVSTACVRVTSSNVYAQDLQADNMLLFQRSYGGWPKHMNDAKIDYTKAFSENTKHDILADSSHKDCTIDNDATTKEIRYLAAAYKKHKNPAYLKAVNKGIKFLLKAQYPIGGWPQYYPDSSSYRGQITYNDNAMVRVLDLLMDASLGINNMDVVDPSLMPAIKSAINGGVDCILLTQIKVKGQLTAWCTQYDQKTLKPAMARKYEFPSLSGHETVGIVTFLMRLETPSANVKQSIKAAVEWLDKVKIVGYRYVDIDDASQPKGKDRVIQPDPSSTIWARFYEIETNEPFFSGRDSIKKKKLSEIDVERRTGYAWYGTWPKKLLEKDYPKWMAKHKAS